MTERSQNIIDNIKASAFPALLAIISFFLIQYNMNQKDVIREMREIHDETIKINGVINLVQYKQSNQNLIDEQQNRRLDNYEQKLINDSNK